VQVAASLNDLDGKQTSSPHLDFKMLTESKRRQPLQFKFPTWGDDLHLMYVAVTRAKKVLHLPNNLVELFKKTQKPDLLLLSEIDSESLENCIAKPRKYSIKITCGCRNIALDEFKRIHA